MIIWNPWKRLREAEEANQDLVNLLVAKEDHIDDLILTNAEMKDLLLEIADLGSKAANGTARKLGRMAEAGVKL